MEPEPDARSFLSTFSDWVESLSFGERDAADRALGRLLDLPGELVLGSSLGLVSRLLESFHPAVPYEIAEALVVHLIHPGPDPERAALLRDVVLAAGGQPARLAGHETEALAVAAIECASFLTQALADREGVVPSSVLRGL